MPESSVISIESLSSGKRAQLRNAMDIPKMYLSIENFDYNPEQKCVVYTIEIGILKGSKVITHQIHKRYSALFEFDELIRPLFRDSRFLLQFPPKKIFGNKQKEFLEQRATELQKYLACLNNVVGVISTPSFLRCFEVDPDLINEE